jgi:ribosomal protein S2
VLERARIQAAEIEAAAEDVRSRADAYAAHKRQKADEAAAELLARAEARQQELDANVERTEERLRRLVGGLRELADRLDVLVGPDELDEALQRQVEAEAAREA